MLVLITDETQAKQEAAECVLLVFHLLLLSLDTFLVRAHLAECFDELGVSLNCIRIEIAGKPREGNLLFIHIDAQVLNS